MKGWNTGKAAPDVHVLWLAEKREKSSCDLREGMHTQCQANEAQD